MNFLKKLTTAGRVIAAVMVLGVSALASGCIEADPPAISVSESIIHVGPGETSVPIRVMTNQKWTATTDAPWITVEKASGNGSTNLSIGIAKYSDSTYGEGRQGTVVFKANGTDPAIVTIHQGNDGKSVLMIAPTEYYVGTEESIAQFNILSNTKWEVMGEYSWARIVDITYDGDSEGLDANQGRGRGLVRIAVDANNSHDAERIPQFSVTTLEGEAITEAFTLVQNDLSDGELALAQYTVNFPAIVAGTDLIPHKVPILTRMTTAPTLYKTATWFSAEIVQDAEYSYVEITPTDNASFASRTDIITVMISDGDDRILMQQITVNQDGAETAMFEVAPVVFNIPASENGGNVTRTAVYYHNGLGTVTVLDGYPTWLASRPTAVNGTNGDPNLITFVATPNPNATERWGQVTLVYESNGAAISRTITIHQDGIGAFTFTVVPEIQALPAVDDPTTVDTNELQFKVYVRSANPEMTRPELMEINGIWLSDMSIEDMSPAPAIGKGWIITVTAQPNTKAAARTGMIDVFATAGNQTHNAVLTVTQSGIGGSSMVVIPRFITVPNEAGGAPSELILRNADKLSGDPILHIEPAGWVEPSLNDTKDRILLTVTGTNTAVNSRRAILYIEGEQGGQTQVLQVLISQPGTGSAEVDVFRTVFEIEATVGDPSLTQQVDIRAIAKNGTTYEVLEYSPESMFAEAPTINVVDGIQQSVQAKINDNTTSADRNAEIVLYAQNGDDYAYYIIVIKQKAAYPEIGATYTASQTIAAIDQTADIAFDNDQDAVFPDPMTPEIQYIGTSSGWLDAATFAVSGTTPNRVVNITDIPMNPGDERSAIITFTLTKAGHVDETVTYTLTQQAILPIGATLVSNQGVIEATETTTQRTLGNLIVFDNDQDATIVLDPAPVVEYIDDVTAITPDWLVGATYSVSGTTPNQEITVSNIPENDEELDRHAKITFTLTKTGYLDQQIEFILTQHVKPAINASLTIYSGEIAATETEKLIEFNNDQGATISPIDPTIDIEYIDVPDWMQNATFTINSASPTSSINVTGIDTNPSTEDRHAHIIINLTKAGYRPQTIHYNLTQLGIPQIWADYRTEYVVEDGALTSYRVDPTSNPNMGQITGAITLDGAPTWVTAAPDADQTTNPGSLEFTLEQNPAGSEPRYVNVSFTLTRDGYEDQLIEFLLVQYPIVDDPTIQLITVGEPSRMAWQAGSTSVVSWTDNNINGNTATVTVVTELIDTTLSGVVVDETAMTATATGALANQTGDIERRIFILRAENAGIVRFYEVVVEQDTFVPEDVLQGLTVNGPASNHDASVTKTGTSITITATPATPNSQIQLDMSFLPGTNPTFRISNQYLAGITIVEYSTTGNYITLRPVSGATGTATFDIVVDVDSVEVTYNVTFIIS